MRYWDLMTAKQVENRTFKCIAFFTSIWSRPCLVVSRDNHTILFLIGDLSLPGSTGTESKGCSWTASQSSSDQRGTRSRERKVAEGSAGATAAGLCTAGVYKSHLIVMVHVPELLRSNCKWILLATVYTFFSGEIYINFCCPGKLFWSEKLFFLLWSGASFLSTALLSYLYIIYQVIHNFDLPRSSIKFSKAFKDQLLNQDFPLRST